MLLLLALTCSVTFGQSSLAPIRLEVGLASQVVAGAWNPIRFVSRDTPPATLTIVIDQGTLRSGPVPLTLVQEIAGGAGVSVYETLVHLNNYSSISWTLRTTDTILASGSLAGREADARPLDLLVSREPGRLRGALGAGARPVDVPAAALPLDSAAYAGVRSLVIDGTAAAPRLEAVAAAASGGTLVVIASELPASHAELALLTPSTGTNHLGAGAVIRAAGDLDDAVAAALAELEEPLLDRLVAALAAEPLVARPVAPPQALVLAIAGAFALLCVLLLRTFRGPGLLGALALAAILSLASWRALRPPEPVISTTGRIGLSGGELALVVEVQEHLTLPPDTISIAGAARPLAVLPYRIDAVGTHFDLGRWRSVRLALPPTVVQAPLRLEAGELLNTGSNELHNVHVVGMGPQANLAPGARAPTQPQEWQAAPSAVYGQLEGVLPAGSAMGTSCDAVCTVWVVAAREAGR